MLPRATVEEIFDDDTDLPLPPIPLQKRPTGSQVQPQVPELTTSRQAFTEQQQHRSQSSSEQDQPRKENVVTDIGPYKKWTSIYPIYIDAKRPYVTGERRIARDTSVWWPLSKDIAQAAGAIGLQCLHEPNKCHPRDWENPGRVKVLWKRDGEIVYPRAQTRKKLIELLSLAIQAARPALKPSTTQVPSHDSQPPVTSSARASTSNLHKGKGKAKAGGSSTKKTRRAKRKNATQHALSTPPKPLPPLAARLSAYSPAIESGLLKETFKGGLNGPGQIPGSEMFLGGGQGANTGQGGGAIPSGGGSKGKRKVVRVRG